MTKKVWFWGTVVVGIIVLFLLFLISIGWFTQKQERVQMGLANPKFPYRNYNQAELNKMYPQYIDYSGVADKQTPEQTHALFLAALKKGDFDAAVNCCFREGDRAKQKEFLNGVKEKGMLDLMISDITKIDPDFKSENKATYIFDGTSKSGEKNAGFMTFVKVSDGIWYIESL
ncbi:MAG: hypothetical protein WCX97_02395 [Candidatus Magasanikbacteria bacterium]